MNYRKVYMRIISHAKSEESLGIRKRGNGNYYEAHHILPRSLFPNWIKRKSNMVLLTAREHFFCHQLLTKIYPHSKMWRALAAFQRKSKGQKRILTSKQYQICKEANSKAQKGKPAWNKGIPRTAEEKAKMSKKRRESEAKLKAIDPLYRQKRVTELTRQKISKSKIGKNNPRAIHWIIKDLETDKVWDFYGGIVKWKREYLLDHKNLFMRNQHPRYRLIKTEKAS